MFARPARAVDRVFIHCSASDRPEHATVDVVRDWHLARGFSDIGYHYLIDFDGVIHPGRSLERIPAAQHGYNTASLAICLTGGQDGQDKAFTAAQFASLRRLAEAIHHSLDGQVTFHGHSEVADKACPAFDYRGLLGLSPTGHLMRPRKTLTKSRTLKGSRVAGLGAGLAAAENVIEPLFDRPSALESRDLDLDLPLEIPVPALPRLSDGEDDPRWTSFPSQQAPQVDSDALARGDFEFAFEGLEVVGRNALAVGEGLTAFLPWLAIGLVVVGIGLIVMARLDDFERGLR